MTGTATDLIREAVEYADEAKDSVDSSDTAQPRLLVEQAAPDRTIARLRDILAARADIFDRGVPVRLAFDKGECGVVAQPMTPEMLILTTHRVCRPYALKEMKGEIREVDVRLPRQFAVMYLDWRGEWKLRPLNGIAPAPLLGEQGEIHFAEGYDPSSGIWSEAVPDLAGLIPDRPTRANADQALRFLRQTFRTFCFADAAMANVAGIMLIDIDRKPGIDESSFLAALLTAICRPSLPLAPGVLIRAAPISGAGAGKGLLARCASLIAFGREPYAVTGGSGSEELEKRISAELMGGSPVLFLDNLNNTAFKSDLLASAITECPARVRVLGRSQMVALNASAFVVMTGNGLTVSEDLARRFLSVELDPKTEDPEARRFENDIRAEIRRDRAALLAAGLTIWRWGQLENALPSGRPIGSFEKWSRWVRDPLIALGCRDPVERLGEAKARDGHRQATAELFKMWWESHADQAIALRDLDLRVLRLVDPHDRGRQFVASQFEKLSGTRIAGLVLTRLKASSKWGVTLYRMNSNDHDAEIRGDHRGHRVNEPADDGSGAEFAAAVLEQGELQNSKTPMPPMTPMRSAPRCERHEMEAEFDERAAVMEHDGGLSREEAEHKARAELSRPQRVVDDTDRSSTTADTSETPLRANRCEEDRSSVA